MEPQDGDGGCCNWYCTSVEKIFKLLKCVDRNRVNLGLLGSLGFWCLPLWLSGSFTAQLYQDFYYCYSKEKIHMNLLHHCAWIHWPQTVQLKWTDCRKPFRLTCRCDWVFILFFCTENLKAQDTGGVLAVDLPDLLDQQIVCWLKLAGFDFVCKVPYNKE